MIQQLLQDPATISKAIQELRSLPNGTNITLTDNTNGISISVRIADTAAGREVEVESRPEIETALAKLITADVATQQRVAQVVVKQPGDFNPVTLN